MTFVGSITGKKVDGTAYKDAIKYTVKQTNNTTDKTIVGSSFPFIGSNDADGTVTFRGSVDPDYLGLSFQPGYLHGKQSVDFDYTVTQEPLFPSKLTDVTLDKDATKTFTLTLKDNQDGTMSVWSGSDKLALWTLGTKHDFLGDHTVWVPTAPSKSLFSFTNTVKETPIAPKHDAKASIKGGVTFTGAASGKAMDGSAYAGALKYTVTQVGDTADKTIVSPSFPFTGSNEADGTVSFRGVVGDKDYLALSFQPGYLDGATSRDFTYQVTQEALYPNKLAGVTLDKQATKTFTLTLKDNQDGTMSVWSGDEQLATWKLETTSGPFGSSSKWVSVAPSKSLFTFDNTVDAAPVTAAPAASVSLSGRAAKAGEFAFALKSADADGVATASDATDGSDDVVATATNAADGTVAFDPLTFTEPGVHTYTLTQVKGDAAGVTYDDTVYTVTVTVTGNDDNTLTAAVAYEKDGEPVDAATFANTYQAPTKPGEQGKPGESDKPAAPNAGKPGAKAAPRAAALSRTGASVLAIAALASACIIAAGSMLAARRRS
ncbi:hypothetical protein JS531_06200 [Bifidobacterium sp. CP2]|uniref:Spy0128 family protein n=1 Tax=Bifidobacterium sp. CP2 TaxID=2809025 RepID=UPI001BDDB0B2|nr:hypothetical protein [Bifidobacterium sp. CP2]